MQTKVWALGIILLLLTMSACGVTTTAPDSSQAAKANQIVCNTAYRSDTGMPIEREESITFQDADSQQTVGFTDLEFHAQYGAGEMNRERSLRLWVTEAGKSDQILSQLYQLPMESGPTNQFIGGHGFTGLNYVYHPTTGAELQYWCTAE